MDGGLKGTRVAFAGFSTRRRCELADVCKARGGTVDVSVSLKTTHLVATTKELERNSTAIYKARTLNVPIVSEDFITSGGLGETSRFLLTHGTPSTTKPDSQTGQSVSASSTTTNTTPASTQRRAPHRPPTAAGGVGLGQWRTARVFISSTFRDMHAERDYLTRHVFPDLEERCARYRIHIVPIDLRWGVTEEDTEGALEICISEVDACRPFFIGLLGDRYGFVPPAEAVVAAAERFPFLSEVGTAVGPAPSITHLEMYYGVLRHFRESGFTENTHSLVGASFYFRDSAFLTRDGVPPLAAAAFAAENDGASTHVAALKAEIVRVFSESGNSHRVFQDYPCRWAGVVDGKPMVGGLEQFGEAVLNTLWEDIKTHFGVRENAVDGDGSVDMTTPQQSPAMAELLEARRHHEQFIENHSRLFVGRRGLLQQMHAFVQQPRAGTALLVVGEPGGGKTSLMAAFTRELLADTGLSPLSTVVLPHFVGSAPGSTNVRKVLDRLCREVVLQMGFSDISENDIPGEYRELCRLFGELLERVATAYHAAARAGRPQRRLVLVLDAVNQLDESHYSHTMDWLPAAVAADADQSAVRVVVSTLRGRHYDAMIRRRTAAGLMHKELVRELVVPELTTDDRREIVATTLWQYRKRLTAGQMAALVGKPDACRPLYLIVACEELRVFGVFEKLSEKIAAMAGTVPELFGEVLARLEGDHGRVMVEAALGLIACSRGGLLETELIALLGVFTSRYFSEDELDGQLARFDESAPPHVWARLFRSLKHYLKNAAGPESASSTLDFFHQQLLFAVRRRYLGDRVRRIRLHRRLAYYYKRQADPSDDATWQGATRHPRAVAELPYHLLEGELWPQLRATLTDLEFVEAKCVVGMTFELAGDYLSAGDNAAVPAEVRSELAAFSEFVVGRAHVLARRPPQTFPMAAAFPENTPVARAAAVRWNDGIEVRPWLRFTNKPCYRNPCKMTLEGHEMPVRAVDVGIGADGATRLVVSASDDQTLKVWNAVRGEEMATLRGHSGSVYACAFSPNGRRIASGSWDRTVRLWDTDTGQELAVLAGHKGNVFTVAFDPDGKMLASASSDKSIRLWDTRKFCEMFSQPKAHKGIVLSIAFAPDGRVLASTGLDKTVRLWRVDNGDNSVSLTELAAYVLPKSANCVRISHESSAGTYRLVCAGDDRLVRILRVDMSTLGPSAVVEEAALAGHCDGVCAAAFLPTNSRYVVSASHDNVVMVWDVDKQQRIASYIGHTGSVFALAFTRTAEQFITCSFDRSVKVWDGAPALRGEFATVTGHTARLLGVAYAPGGRRLATASRDKLVKLWDVQTATETATLAGHRSNVFACRFSPNGQWLATASRDGSTKIWDVNTAMAVATLSGHGNQPINDVAWNPDGNMLVTASGDKLLKLWRIDMSKREFEEIGTLYGHRGAVNCCEFSPNGAKIVSGGDDGVLKLWDAATRRKLATLSGHSRPVTCAVFSVDSRRVLSGSEDKTIREWSADNAKPLAVMCGHSATVTDVAYTKDGQYVVSVGTDSLVIWWRTDTKTEAVAFAASSRCTCVDTSPLDKTIAVGDGSGQLYLLEPVGLYEARQAERTTQ